MPGPDRGQARSTRDSWGPDGALRGAQRLRDEGQLESACVQTPIGALLSTIPGNGRESGKLGEKDGIVRLTTSQGPDGGLVRRGRAGRARRGGGLQGSRHLPRPGARGTAVAGCRRHPQARRGRRTGARLHARRHRRYARGGRNLVSQQGPTDHRPAGRGACSPTASQPATPDPRAPRQNTWKRPTADGTTTPSPNSLRKAWTARNPVQWPGTMRSRRERHTIPARNAPRGRRDRPGPPPEVPARFNEAVRQIPGGSLERGKS